MLTLNACQHKNTVEITEGCSIACLDCQCVLVDSPPWKSKKESFIWLVNRTLIKEERLLELLG